MFSRAHHAASTNCAEFRVLWVVEEVLDYPQNGFSESDEVLIIDSRLQEAQCFIHCVETAVAKANSSKLHCCSI